MEWLGLGGWHMKCCLGDSLVDRDLGASFSQVELVAQEPSQQEIVLAYPHGESTATRPDSGNAEAFSSLDLAIRSKSRTPEGCQ